MGKKVPKVTIEKVEKEPMSFELANWFLANPNDTFPHDIIAKRIKRIKEARGILVDVNVGIPASEYHQFIQKVREHLETKFECTLINVRLPSDGRSFGAYKIGTPQEATEYGVRQYKAFILKGERVRRITPLMKKEYIWPSVKKVFGEAQEQVERFKKLGDRFLLGYQEDVDKLKEKAEEKK